MTTQEELRQRAFVNVEAKLNVHHFDVFDRPSSVRSQRLFSTSRLTRLHPSDLPDCRYPSQGISQIPSPIRAHHLQHDATYTDFFPSLLLPNY